MDEDLSMDSFVDIVANTVGIVIILTMLTIGNIDERNEEVDSVLKEKMDVLRKEQSDLTGLASTILGNSGDLATAGSGLGLKALDPEKLDGKSQLEKAMSLLARIGEIKANSVEIEKKLDLATIRQDGAEDAAKKISDSLVSLRTRKKSLKTAIRTRKAVEAKLLTALPSSDMQTFGRTQLSSLKSEVKKLESDIDTMNQEAKMGKKKFEDLEKAVAALRKDEVTVGEELVDLREVTTGLNIKIVAPPPLREQGKFPVFFECYSETPETGDKRALRVRPIGLGASPDGEYYRDIGGPESAFYKYVSRQPAEFKASHRLHFIVRPGAAVAFRKAREVAHAAGWTVGWNPIRNGVKLKIGKPSPPPSASAGTQPVIASR